MSKITLVRIDGDTKHEVDIHVGETVIGRGPVMQCDDLRVSRTHAKIKVSEDGKIELTSTSKNPCYYNDETVISKSSSVELQIGDRFSFLPANYCYCVKAGSSSNSVSKQERPSEVEENDCPPVNADSGCSIVLTPPSDDSDNEKSAVRANACVISEVTDSDVLSNSVNDDSNVVSSISAKKFIPSWLLAATNCVKQGKEEPSGKALATEKVKTEDVAGKTDEANQRHNLDMAQNSVVSAKRKTDGVSTKACQPATSAAVLHQMSDDSEPDETAGLAGDTEQALTSGGTVEKTQGSDGDSAATDSIHPHSPARTSSRNPCKYGTACYRKNPQHLAEYSHPGDPDYTEDVRPECTYGTDCYRKNPLHRQNYKHTEKPQKPPKKRQRTKAADADENSAEDDYDYDDPFLNDASSDDYEPSGSGSEVSASESEEEEDMERTKKEAKRFVQGKRKH